MSRGVLSLPQSGPFALINARWPDETWEQLNTPHLVRQALPD